VPSPRCWSVTTGQGASPGSPDPRPQCLLDPRNVAPAPRTRRVRQRRIATRAREVRLSRHRHRTRLRPSAFCRKSRKPCCGSTSRVRGRGHLGGGASVASRSSKACVAQFAAVT
jgi:hypothetical protein